MLRNKITKYEKNTKIKGQLHLNTTNRYQHHTTHHQSYIERTNVVIALI